MLRPMVWQVGMYDLWRSDRSVSAQPKHAVRRHEQTSARGARKTHRRPRYLDESVSEDGVLGAHRQD